MTRGALPALLAMTAGLTLAACGESGTGNPPGTAGSGSPTSATSAPGSSAVELADLCDALTASEVSAVLDAPVTQERGGPIEPDLCRYDTSPNHVVLIVTLEALTSADQAGMDAKVSHEATALDVSPIRGLGDGTATLGRHLHDPGVTIFARTGDHVLILALLAGPGDLAHDAETLAKAALTRL